MLKLVKQYNGVTFWSSRLPVYVILGILRYTDRR